MTDPALDALVLSRLDRLERENRRYRRAAAGAGLTLFAWAACSVAPAPQSTVSAERFVLVSADGTEKASLQLDSNGEPILELRSGSGAAILTTNGPALLLRGADGKTGAFMGIDSKNTSRMELCTSRLVDGVRLSAHADGSAGIYALDPGGRARASLESFAQGGAALSFLDSTGKLRAHVGQDESGVPDLVFLDENGARRLGMVIQADGNPLLEMADGKGRARTQLSTLFDGSPSLEFKREDGTVSFQAP